MEENQYGGFEQMGFFYGTKWRKCPFLPQNFTCSPQAHCRLDATQNLSLLKFHSSQYTQDGRTLVTGVWSTLSLSFFCHFLDRSGILYTCFHTSPLFHARTWDYITPPRPTSYTVNAVVWTAPNMYTQEGPQSPSNVSVSGTAEPGLLGWSPWLPDHGWITEAQIVVN